MRLREESGYAETLIFYEAPHRLRGTLAELAAAFGDREAVLARELTKRFEEFRRGTLTSLLAACDAQEIRGEFVIVVAGAQAAECSDDLGHTPGGTLNPAVYVARLMAEGQSKKEAMREAARALGLSRRAVYQALLTKTSG